MNQENQPVADELPRAMAAFPSFNPKAAGLALAALAGAPGSVQAMSLIQDIFALSGNFTTLLQVLDLLRQHQGDIMATITALRALYAALQQILHPQPPTPVPPAA